MVLLLIVFITAQFSFVMTGPSIIVQSGGGTREGQPEGNGPGTPIGNRIAKREVMDQVQVTLLVSNQSYELAILECEKGCGNDDRPWMFSGKLPLDFCLKTKNEGKFLDMYLGHKEIVKVNGKLAIGYTPRVDDCDEAMNHLHEAKIEAKQSSIFEWCGRPIFITDVKIKCIKNRRFITHSDFMFL